MWQGFVTVGRGELLLTLGAVALLMFVVGIAAGQIYLMIKRPAPLKLRPLSPEDEKRATALLRSACKSPHCDDDEQLAEWLRQRDYGIITNEVAAEHGLLPGQSARGESTGRHSKTDLLTPPPLWWERAENGDLTPGPSHPGWPTEEPK